MTLDTLKEEEPKWLVGDLIKHEIRLSVIQILLVGPRWYDYRYHVPDPNHPFALGTYRASFNTFHTPHYVLLSRPRVFHPLVRSERSLEL